MKDLGIPLLAPRMNALGTPRHRTPFLLVSLVLLALYCLPTPVLAQGEPPKVTTQLWLDMPSPATLERIRDVIYGSGLALAENGLPVALQLYNLLLGIAIVWLGIRMFLASKTEGLEDVISSFITLILTWGLGFWFLTQYAWLVSEISQGFEQAAAALTGADMSISVFNVIAFTGAILTNLFASIGDLPWVDTIWDVSVMAFIFNIAATLMLVAFMLIMMVVGAVYAALYILSAGMLAFAVALGPFFIPWILFEQSAFLWWNWFRLLLVAGMYNLVAPVIFSIVGNLLSGDVVADAQLVTKGPDGDYTFHVLMGLSLMVIALVFALFLFQVPKLAEMLVGGGHGGSSSIAGATGTLSKAVQGRMGKQSGG